MRLSGSNYGMPTLPIDAALDAHHELALEAIEVTVLPGYATALETWTAEERRRVVRRLRELGMQVSGVADFQAIAEPDRDAAERVMAHHRGAIELAADLAYADAPPLVPCTAGLGPEQWPEARTRLIDRIGKLAEHASRHGVTLVMKAHALNCVSRPYHLIDLLEQVDSAAFRFCFDMSHYEVQGLSIEQAMYPLLALSPHLEMKASVGRAPDQEYMIPGESDVQSDFVGQFRAMQKLGYRGYVVPEMSVHVQRRPDYDQYGSLRLAITYLRGLMREVGIGA